MTAGRNNAESLSQHWCTPPKYVEAIRRFFSGRIALDPCSNQYSIVRAEVEYTLPEVDGLTASWDFPTVFVNPPYGSDRKRGTTIRDWLRRCAESHRTHHAEVLALVPVATNTRHWKVYVWGAATAVAFLYDTRLRFLVNGKDGGKGAPMSCAMVYWGVDYALFEEVFVRFGAVVDVRHLHDKEVGVGEHRTLFEHERRFHGVSGWRGGRSPTRTPKS
ncbi:MAG: hypothetical protein JW809_18555 [Pirellulales bacterium]|nr:hypothetical protein [Pirellulales bacterium]